MKKRVKKEKRKYDRRNFLKKGILAGGTVILGNKVSQAFSDKIAAGEKIKVLTSERKLVEVDVSTIEEPVNSSKVVNIEARKGIPGRKFVMVIDLSRCNNTRKCQTACQQMHNLAETDIWLKVLRMQDAETTEPYWMPMPCFHCDKPLCVKVCPVDATFKREDGIVLIDNERCIGCRFCMIGCPYSARTFNWSKPEVPKNIADIQYSPETSIPRKMGTVEKCDFCGDMLRKGILPDCVTACPNGVYYFGDIYEDTVTNGSETIRFSELIEDKAGYRFLEYLGTEPCVYYLPPVNRLFPFKEYSNDNNPEET